MKSISDLLFQINTLAKDMQQRQIALDKASYVYCNDVRCALNTVQDTLKTVKSYNSDSVCVESVIQKIESCADELEVLVSNIQKNQSK